MALGGELFCDPNPAPRRRGGGGGGGGYGDRYEDRGRDRYDGGGGGGGGGRDYDRRCALDTMPCSECRLRRPNACLNAGQRVRV